jgi:predicted nucleic acid-binding Zn ribbon protein
VRRLAPRRLDSALAELSKQLAPATTLARVQARWPDAAGEAIAAEAEPVSERAGVVTLACRSAVWAQELDLLSADLIGRLNELLGEPGKGGPVRSIRTVVGTPERR